MNNLQINKLNNGYAPPARTSVTNFIGANNSVLQHDTVEISSKENKKNNLGIKLLLCALEVGAVIFAFVKLHKTSAIKPKEELSAELKEIQQIYKDIFGRNINAEETKDFTQRYKKIIDSKTPDNDREYCEKLLDELCKDRQTKRPRILRWITNRAEVAPSCKNADMVTSPDGTYIDIYVCNYRNNPAVSILERDLFKSLFHETHHVKQDEIIYRTNKEDFLTYLVDKYIKENENTSMTKNEITQRMSRQIDRHWGCFEPFIKDSVEYNEGIRLLEGEKNYKPPYNHTTEEYHNQITEIGAFADGTKAKRLFDLLKQISL